MESFIERCGGPVKAARLLRVDYAGALAKWRNGTRPLPKYIEASIEAHMLLSDRVFAKVLAQRAA